jgi:hypothetical protein
MNEGSARRPQGSYRCTVRSNNLALVPASMLPFRREWQRIANDLPHGDTLFVIPDQDLPITRSMRSIAELLRQRGHRVTAVQTDHFT